jgi:hypothetical protein
LNDINWQDAGKEGSQRVPGTKLMIGKKTAKRSGGGQFVAGLIGAIQTALQFFFPCRIAPVLLRFIARQGYKSPDLRSRSVGLRRIER